MNLKLSYKKGKAHQDADAMSRRGDEDEEVASDDDNFFGLTFLDSLEFLGRYRLLHLK